VFVDAVAQGDAREARSWKTGTVTAFSGGVITATIDETSVGNIHRISTYTTPVNGDTALFAVMRGTKPGSVQYLAIGKIT
jgi:hypothetical protein